MVMVASTLASGLKDLKTVRTVTDKGTWDADLNVPELSSSAGSDGDYYTVSVGGTTELDGLENWQLGDIVLFNAGSWTNPGTPTLPSDMTEDTAIGIIAGAFTTYFYGATAGAIPVVPGTLDAAKSAMEDDMVGMSEEDQGAAKIQAGIEAFWGNVATNVATIFVAAPPATALTAPTGNPTLATAVIEPVFIANTAGSLSLDASADALAAAIHAVQIVGGICTFPAIPTGLGPLPIL